MQVNHLYYIIRAGILDNRAIARAFRTGFEAPSGIIAEVEGDDPEHAVKLMRKHLDKLERDRLHRRRLDKANGRIVPTVAEYQQALLASRISPTTLEMLRAATAAGTAGISTEALCEIYGDGVPAMVSMFLSKACREIISQIDVAGASFFSSEPVSPRMKCWSQAADVAASKKPWVLYEEARMAIADMPVEIRDDMRELEAA